MARFLARVRKASSGGSPSYVVTIPSKIIKDKNMKLGDFVEIQIRPVSIVPVDDEEEENA